MLNRNVVFPSLIIIISALALYVISLFDAPMFQEASVDAKFFPRVIVIGQIILCLALLVQHKLAKKEVSDKSEHSEPPILSKRSLFGLGFLVGYTVLIYSVGYLIASLIAFVFYLLYFKVKKPLYYLVAVVFVFCIYYLFGEVFFIALPEGALF